MSSRFEKIIAGAVMAGAIGLAGCDAGSSGSGAGNGDGIAPTLVGARTVSSTEIELTFSEAVTVSDPAAAAAMFVLNRNILNYGFNYASTTIASVYYPTAAYPYYSFQSGSAIGAVTDVQSVSASPEKLTLTIDTAIVEDVDHGGTGMLRLTYTGAEGGVSDEAGSALGAIALDSTQRGNVLDATGDPVLIDARTIDSNTIELTFNE
ncbi:MAG: hypothetical protein IIA41_08355, partial [SAR324 cluster bacterium]|nr:hypothetical protein [SAR324 cluster bacterium]